MTDTQTLADWLLERIAEDEAVARAVEASPDFEPQPFTTARVLAECAAKRRIVDAHPRLSIGADDSCEVCADDGAWYDRGMLDWPCDTLRALASVYAGQPGWREEWR